MAASHAALAAAEDAHQAEKLRLKADVLALVAAKQQRAASHVEGLQTETQHVRAQLQQAEAQRDALSEECRVLKHKCAVSTQRRLRCSLGCSHAAAVVAARMPQPDACGAVYRLASDRELATLVAQLHQQQPARDAAPSADRCAALGCPAAPLQATSLSSPAARACRAQVEELLQRFAAQEAAAKAEAEASAAQSAAVLTALQGVMRDLQTQMKATQV